MAGVLVERGSTIVFIDQYGNEWFTVVNPAFVSLANSIPAGNNTIGGVIPRNLNGDQLFTDENPGKVDGTIEGSVTINGRTVQPEFTFQNSATLANDGTANKLTLNGSNSVLLSISRSSITANSISFKATGPNGVAGYVFGYKVNSDSTITTGTGSTSTASEIWLISDLAGYVDFFVPINSMTGSSITVKGKAVA